MSVNRHVVFRELENELGFRSKNVPLVEGDLRPPFLEDETPGSKLASRRNFQNKAIE